MIQDKPTTSENKFILALIIILSLSWSTPSYADKEQNNANNFKSNIEKPIKCSNLPSSKQWIDRFRSGSHQRLCKTVMWVDRRFGDEHEFEDENFRGKLSIGFREDEDDGFDPRIRVRIKAKFPNISDRFNAFIGKVEEDSYISNTEVNEDSVSNVGLRSTNDDEDEWLIGLGYRDPSKTGKGFDYSIGAKLSSGLSLYTKIAHRHLFHPSDNHYWRTTQTGFWRKKDGLGVSSKLDYTYIIGDRDIAEWDTSIKYTEDERQWEWITSGNWHHSITDKTGVSSRIYVRGEEENPVSIPEYGVTFTYIRPFLRPWLFIETGVDFRWEKEYLDSSYKSATKFSFQLEMLLGDYYHRANNK